MTAAAERVLVTGASGFVGRQAVAALRSSGFEVVAVSSHERVGAPDVVWRQCDLLDAVQTERLLAEVHPTRLLHLAWYTEAGKYWESPENPRWLDATRTIARAFGSIGGQRFVGAGSCAEYDWTVGDGICRETSTPLRPCSLYGRSKDAARAAVESEAREFGFSAVWGRIFHLYGPFEHPSRLISSMIVALLSGGDARTSHGEQVRDFMHVADVGAAFASLLDSSVEGAVNLGTGRSLPIREVALAIADRLGARDRLRPGAIPARADDPPRLVPDVRRLQDEVGFSPRYVLEDGLEQTIAWWREAVSVRAR